MNQTARLPGKAAISPNTIRWLVTVRLKHSEGYLLYEQGVEEVDALPQGKERQRVEFGFSSGESLAIHDGLWANAYIYVGGSIDCGDGPEGFEEGSALLADRVVKLHEDLSPLIDDTIERRRPRM